MGRIVHTGDTHIGYLQYHLHSRREDFLYSFLQFVLFALGMGAVIISLTISMAVLRQGIIRLFRNIIPVIQPVCACLMFLAGLYIVFYWITVGEVIELP